MRVLTVAAATAAAAAAFATGTLAGPVPQLVRVDQATADKFGAKSLDGSVPAYYFAPAVNASTKNRWVLYFKGGGWCIDDESCAARAKSELGSSKGLAATFEFEAGFSSSDCSLNEVFCDANRVILWYTDGGSFTGNAAAPAVVNGDQVWYRGHPNLQAIIESLKTNHGLGEATEVLISGGSAGGLASYLHADEVKAMIGSPALSKYKVAPASGFFLNHTNAVDQIVYGQQMAYIFGIMNSTGGVPLSCRQRVGPGREHECITAAAVWQTMETPIFMMNSAIDSWQMDCIFTSVPVPLNSTGMGCHALPSPWPCVSSYHTCPYSPVVQGMLKYRADFLAAYNSGPTATKPGNGAFVHSCVSHVASQGEAWKQIMINGTSFHEAAQAWWLDDVTAPASKHTHLPCEFKNEAPFQCNPTCGSA